MKEDGRNELYMRIFSKVLSLSDDGFIVVDRQGDILDINEPYAKFLMTSREEAIGRSILDFIPNSRMLEIMENKETEEGAIHNYQEGTTLDESVIVSRSYVEDDRGQVIGGVAQVKFRVASLDVSKKLLDQYSMLKYYQEEYQALAEISSGFDEVIGEDPAFIAQKNEAYNIAKTDFTVLLTGETGTGKELFARAIHNSSPRQDYPMVSINCAAIPEELFESELFGYEEGAFTGAKKGGKKGKFELANRGTLFLDEIADLPLPMQAKLLRVLEDKKIDPIGSTRPKEVDVRLICATRKNLQDLVRSGDFRIDLYYRINVVNLELIPLRERKGDIIRMADFFLAKLNEEYFREVRFSDEVKLVFYSYDWLGNARELDNVIKSAFAVCPGDLIRVHDLPARIAGGEAQPGLGPLTSYKEAMDRYEKSFLEAALREAGGNVSQAADLVGIHRSLFYKKINKQDIDLDSFRDR